MALFRFSILWLPGSYERFSSVKFVNLTSQLACSALENRETAIVGE